MSDYTLPAIDRLRRAVARDLMDTFEKGDLPAVYRRARVIAPALYTAKDPLSPAALEKATDLIADCFLLLKDKPSQKGRRAP